MREPNSLRKAAWQAETGLVTPDTSSKLRLLRSTFPTLDEWGVDLESAFVPGQGSALAVDDTDWIPVPVSQVAVMGLGSARDHLQAVRVLIEAGQVFPFAHSTLIRSAVVGGAQAVWVLAPEDPATRIDRARLLAEHMYVEPQVPRRPAADRPRAAHEHRACRGACSTSSG